MTSRLTTQELEALDKLSEAINALYALPECHPDDARELTTHFHAIQTIVMARVAVRAHPEQFNSSCDFE